MCKGKKLNGISSCNGERAFPDDANGVDVGIHEKVDGGRKVSKQDCHPRMRSSWLSTVIRTLSRDRTFTLARHYARGSPSGSGGAELSASPSSVSVPSSASPSSSVLVAALRYRGVKSFHGSPEELAKHIANRPTIVDFYTTWCGPCKALAPMVESLSRSTPSVTFVKVDVEANPDLGAAYHVSSVPKFVAFDRTGTICGTVDGAVIEEVKRLADDLARHHATHELSTAAGGLGEAPTAVKNSLQSSGDDVPPSAGAS